MTQADTRPTSNFDPHDPALAPVQHQVLTDLLTRCPVSWSEKHGGFWSLTKFDDVVDAARTYQSFTVEQGVIVPSLGASTPIPPAQVDPPAHTAYRKILLPFFNPKAVLDYEDLIREIVRDAIGQFAGRGAAELSQELAHPVPTVAIAAILGLDRTQWRVIRDLVDDYLLAATQGPEAKRKAAGAFEEMVRSVIAERRGKPVTDRLGAIVNSQIDGAPIADHMILGMVHVLITAGHETTINGIANVLCHLLSVPGLRDRVLADRSLIPAVIAESLRLESPVMCMARTVTEDTEVRGVALGAHEKVILLYGAANLDPDRFANPTEFSLDRGRPHIAFGSGPHRCIGEHLAMVEMRVAMEEMLDSFPDLRLCDDDPPVWGSGAVRRGVRRLPVRFTPVRQT
ncbi:MAG TPA: cytochrome P450 [Pseudonocardia sp.]|jgi:cytochrome P450